MKEIDYSKRLVSPSQMKTICGKKTMTKGWYSMADRIIDNQLGLTEDFSSFWIEHGREMEPCADQEFRRKTGKRVEKTDNRVNDREYEFINGTTDGELLDENALTEWKCPKHKNHLLNIKTTKYLEKYKWQIQTYHRIYDTYLCYFGTFSLWSPIKRLHIREVTRDQEMIDFIIERSNIFWNKCFLPKWREATKTIN